MASRKGNDTRNPKHKAEAVWRRRVREVRPSDGTLLWWRQCARALARSLGCVDACSFCKRGLMENPKSPRKTNRLFILRARGYGIQRPCCESCGSTIRDMLKDMEWHLDNSHLPPEII